MDRIKLILIYVSVGLSFGLVRGQQIGNYIGNGSFEQFSNCSNNNLNDAKYWTGVDSIYAGCCIMATCNGNVPNGFNMIYQLPRTGHVMASTSLFIDCPIPPWHCRGYFRNRLLARLDSGIAYCVKFYVNIANMSPVGNDGMGIYFGDSSLDTITQEFIPLTYLNPQVKCPSGVPIVDTLGWTLVSGTFTASGTEKYAIIGVFAADQNVMLAPINTTLNTFDWTDGVVDDVSCIPVNLPAYAGPNKLIYVGDSTFIGRQPDFATDSGCIWYKLPNMTVPIDTISGLWVKPTVTSTYVVRQELDCSPLKWDTVVVTINTNLVSLDKLHELLADISLFPNPTSGNLKVSHSGSTDLDITSYVVINSLGQTVRDEFVHAIPVDINTSDLGPGLYEIQFRSRYGILTKKFVRTD
jgi:hypothetical protein